MPIIETTLTLPETIPNAIESIIGMTALGQNALTDLMETWNDITKHLANADYWKAKGKEYGDRNWPVPVDAGDENIRTWIQIKDSNDFNLQMSHYYHDGISISRFDDSKALNDVNKEFFKESFRAVEAELYHPALTSLTAIFDGLLYDVAVKLGNPGKKKGATQFISRTKLLVGSRKGDKLQTLHARTISLLQFNESFAGNIDFTDRVGAHQLNRHWLMHGRTERPCTLMDYLQLLSFLDVLVDIHRVVNLGGNP